MQTFLYNYCLTNLQTTLVQSSLQDCYLAILRPILVPISLYNFANNLPIVKHCCTTLPVLPLWSKIIAQSAFDPSTSHLCLIYYCTISSQPIYTLLFHSFEFSLHSKLCSFILSISFCAWGNSNWWLAD